MTCKKGGVPLVCIAVLNGLDCIVESTNILDTVLTMLERTLPPTGIEKFRRSWNQTEAIIVWVGIVGGGDVHATRSLPSTNWTTYAVYERLPPYPGDPPHPARPPTARPPPAAHRPAHANANHLRSLDDHLIIALTIISASSRKPQVTFSSSSVVH